MLVIHFKRRNNYDRDVMCWYIHDVMVISYSCTTLPMTDFQKRFAFSQYNN